jgi:hypothetical protein
MTQIGYLEPESDLKVGSPFVTAPEDTLQEFWWLQAGIVWNVLPATDFEAIASYTTPSFDDATIGDDSGWGLYTKIKVKF